MCIGNCQEAFAAGDDNNGEKTLYTDTNETFTLHCKYFDDRNVGLAHLTNNFVSSSVNIDVSRLSSDFTKVSLVFYNGSREYRADIRRMDGGDLTVLRSSSTGFTSPSNADIHNYIFLGIMRANEIGAGILNGFILNNKSCTFLNVGVTSNSYFAFFDAVGESHSNFGFLKDCLKSNLVEARRVPAGNGFKFFTEAHFGGGGALMTSTGIAEYDSASIGLWFEYGV